uniref:Uncharacterized protein n=1 Tax=Steinernema glaseri TaxID=37863 RepID=A0A1I7YIA6_9BILA
MENRRHHALSSCVRKPTVLIVVFIVALSLLLGGYFFWNSTEDAHDSLTDASKLTDAPTLTDSPTLTDAPTTVTASEVEEIPFPLFKDLSVVSFPGLCGTELEDTLSQICVRQGAPFNLPCYAKSPFLGPHVDPDDLTAAGILCCRKSCDLALLRALVCCGQAKCWDNCFGRFHSFKKNMPNATLVEGDPVFS